MRTAVGEREQQRADGRERAAVVIIDGAVLVAATAMTSVSLIWLSGPVMIVSLLLGGLMLAIAHIDANSLRIPDVLSLPAIPLGLLSSAFLMPGNAPWLVAVAHVAGMLVGGLGLWLVRIIYARMRGREGLGLGDVKLAAAAGAWTGLESLADVLLLACVIAIAGLMLQQLVTGRGTTATSAVPFGAALAPAIWIVWFRDTLHFAG